MKIKVSLADMTTRGILKYRQPQYNTSKRGHTQIPNGPTRNPTMDFAITIISSKTK